MGTFVSGFDWLNNKINKDLFMLQERNSVLERQLKIVLKSIMTKETQSKPKKKGKEIAIVIVLRILA